MSLLTTLHRRPCGCARWRSVESATHSAIQHLMRWVEKMAELTKPDVIHWVDGSKEENEALCGQMVESGTFIKLNEELWPGCFYARSDASDVARVEDRTFICSLSKDAAGPTNNWEEPFQMRRKLKELFDGSMRGRTMYVLPFSMGPIGSPMSQIGAAHDSPYVVETCASWIASVSGVRRERQDSSALAVMHSVGAPLRLARRGPAINKEKYIVHSRDTRDLVVRMGTVHASRKNEALRIASNMARARDGWRDMRSSASKARGRKDYVTAAFRCLRQTNLHADSTGGFRRLAGRTVGDDTRGSSTTLAALVAIIRVVYLGSRGTWSNQSNAWPAARNPCSQTAHYS